MLILATVGQLVKPVKLLVIATGKFIFSNFTLTILNFLVVKSDFQRGGGSPSGEV